MLRVIPFLLCLMAFLSAPSFAAEKEIPFREDSGLTKVEYLLSAGQFSAALETSMDVIARHPRNADAYTYMGYAYQQLGESAAAIKNFRKALDFDPAHLGANKYLADAYLEAGEIARAIEQLQVIRMICGKTDCEELRVLQRDVDRHKREGLQKKNGGKKEKDEEFSP